MSESIPPFDPSRYGETLAGLLQESHLMPLAEGGPVREMEPWLHALDMTEALKPHTIADPAMAHACKSGLWLYYNFLEKSHVISQDIASPTGSYWHGIMHRREPDYSNAKYWFRRVGEHPIFPAVCEEAGRLAEANGAEVLRELDRWDPFAFVDLCEQAARGRSELVMLCRQVQQREWELLFDYSFREAVGETVSGL